MKRTINKEIKTVTILCFTLFFALLPSFNHCHNKNSSIFFENKIQENNSDRHNEQPKKYSSFIGLKRFIKILLRFLFLGLIFLFFGSLVILIIFKLATLRSFRSLRLFRSSRLFQLSYLGDHSPVIDNYYQLKAREEDMDLYFENYKKIFEQKSYLESLDKNDNYYETFDYIYGNIDRRPFREMFNFLDSSPDNENKIIIFTFGYKDEEKTRVYDFLLTKNYYPYMHDITFEKFLDRFLQRDFKHNTNEQNVYDSLVNLFMYLLAYPKKICFVSKKGKEEYKKENNSSLTKIFNFNIFKSKQNEEETLFKKQKTLNDDEEMPLKPNKKEQETLNDEEKMLLNKEQETLNDDKEMLLNKKKETLLDKSNFTFDFNYFYKLLSENVHEKDKHKLLHFQLEEEKKTLNSFKETKES